MPIKKFLLILIPIYIFFNLNINGNYLTYKWLFFDIALPLVIFVFIWRRFSVYLGLTFGYFLSDNAIQSILTQNPYHLLSNSKGALTVLLSAFFLINLKDYISEKISSFLTIILLACCIQVFIGFPFYGLTGNTSLNATIISLLLPLCIPFLKKFYAGEYYFFLISFIAIIQTKASLGLIALILSATTYLFLNEKTLLKYFYTLFPIITGSIGYYFYSDSLYSLSGRPDIWNSMWQYIKNEGNIFFGTGIGSGFYLIQKSILKYSVVKKELTPWGHNEILQVFFEGGLVGLLLCAASFIHFIVTTIKKQRIYLTAFGISYLINCAGNFPHRLAPDTFLILIAIILAYKESNFEKA